MGETELITRNISLQKDIATQADIEAERLGLNFSAFLRLLLQNYFNGVTFEKKKKNEKEES